jgi:hypothetical protein
MILMFVCTQKLCIHDNILILLSKINQNHNSKDPIDQLNQSGQRLLEFKKHIKLQMMK